MPFQKGVSGNPGGRPKKDWTWGQMLETIGEETELKSGKKFKELVSRRLWVECVNGNITAIKELFNRMEGLPMQFTDVTSDGKQLPITIIAGSGFIPPGVEVTQIPEGSATTEQAAVQGIGVAQTGKENDNGDNRTG